MQKQARALYDSKLLTNHRERARGTQFSCSKVLCVDSDSQSVSMPPGPPRQKFIPPSRPRWLIFEAAKGRLYLSLCLTERERSCLFLLLLPRPACLFLIKVLYMRFQLGTKVQGRSRVQPVQILFIVLPLNRPLTVASQRVEMPFHCDGVGVRGGDNNNKGKGVGDCLLIVCVSVSCRVRL